MGPRLDITLLPKECIAGVASRAKTIPWRIMTAVVIQSNVLFAMTTCARLTRLFRDPPDSPGRLTIS